MPKRGSLKSAGKRQESATFLQRSFFNVALQFFACCSAALGQNDIRSAEKPMLQCNFCSAAFRKLQRNFHFRLWHVAGVLEGWGLGLADKGTYKEHCRKDPGHNRRLSKKLGTPRPSLSVERLKARQSLEKKGASVHKE